MHVRDWLTETVSAGIGKRVTISGPVTWTLSLEPTVVLKQVAVAEKSDHGFSDLVTADTVEVAIDLPSLLRRSIIIPPGLDILASTKSARGYGSASSEAEASRFQPDAH